MKRRPFTISSGNSVTIRDCASRGNSETSIASSRTRRPSTANAEATRSVYAEYGS